MGPGWGLERNAGIESVAEADGRPRTGRDLQEVVHEALVVESSRAPGCVFEDGAVKRRCLCEAHAGADGRRDPGTEGFPEARDEKPRDAAAHIVEGGHDEGYVEVVDLVGRTSGGADARERFQHLVQAEEGEVFDLGGDDVLVGEGEGCYGKGDEGSSAVDEDQVIGIGASAEGTAEGLFQLDIIRTLAGRVGERGIAREQVDRFPGGEDSAREAEMAGEDVGEGWRGRGAKGVGETCVGIGVDEEDMLSDPREAGREVYGGGGFPRSAFEVDDRDRAQGSPRFCT